ncbi:MAG: HAD family hydrolase [Verrucomicrobiota bacterium]|nr:HAD family hydrolase [Verrucomicrobiota bacterium]MEC8332600.1 HAD family hydrolase [Verrucomicrobiota bacterium]
MGYKHVIWDWNGTLVDDTWLCVDVLNELLKRRGRRPISEIEYREHFEFPVIKFYEYLGLETDENNYEQTSREFITDYESRWLEQCALHQDACDVLQAISAKGLTQSVLSAARQETLQLGIDHYGIGSHFMGLVGTDNIHAEGKISRGLYWVEQLPWSPKQIVLIGDTLHDLEVAQAIGSDCILLAHGHHTAQRLTSTGKRVVHSLRELEFLLEP